MLSVQDLHAWYGPSHVLQGVALDVRRGEIVALIGRNGAGKTTTLKSIMGMLARRSGRIAFDGHDLSTLPVHARFRLGLGYVPEDRRIVPGLSVRDNLRLGLLMAKTRARERDTIDRIVSVFPRLGERLEQEGTSLSGGEQQMLAIARAMVSEPTMLLIDEPTEGIMPILVEELAALFVRLKAAGTTILLVEQNVELALSIADRGYIMDHGVVEHHAPAAALLADTTIQERYCWV
ncbi:MAG: ABC transporter ATP-binding protein [Candidatus Rokubacteria bacterium GWF2_70_14]|mgnify:FL=1|jgi:branched-chain amino acid transport system ATP-binding protein|nr:MAG: ABC transporter ATP-binding protein [Candidatus Rokubacteria bacterium GWA2_70_23]OGK94338.1 MAG: ABC transporter ATP-binding protein [Candidatus Rokubacteria bacterium GWF2_70_14]OGL02717.1 MAG: ABC transporter ATP-binding protein [Candidatus Rokubacteria bacterium RIFCSPHIGHO2_02_FULL_73_26]